jgi:WD40 repeat protein
LTTYKCKYNLTGHTSDVYGLKQITSQIFSSSSGDSTIKLWNKTNGQEVRTLTGHLNYIQSSIDVLDNGQILVSGSGDQTIKMWNISNGQVFKTTQTNSDIQSLAVIAKQTIQMGKCKSYYLMFVFSSTKFFILIHWLKFRKVFKILFVSKFRLVPKVIFFKEKSSQVTLESKS